MVGIGQKSLKHFNYIFPSLKSIWKKDDFQWNIYLVFLAKFIPSPLKGTLFMILMAFIKGTRYHLHHYINRPFHKLRPWSTLASIWKIAKVALMSLKTYNHTDLVNLTETNCKCSCSRDIICEKGFKNLLVFVTFSKVGSHSIYWGTFKSFYVKPSLELDET